MNTTDYILFALTDRSMAHVMLHFIQHRRALRRERLLRDRLNPLEKYDDVEIKALFRFERHNILEITNDLRILIEHPTGRNKALSPLHQVCVFFTICSNRLYANIYSFMDKCGQKYRIPNCLAGSVAGKICWKIYFPPILHCTRNTH